MSSRRPPVAVSIEPTATNLITAAAGAAHPQETGGVLLGWWDAGAIVVRRAIEVPDQFATTTSWNRAEQTAQSALESALADDPHSWLGYVGDWHTHPANRGPSSQDLAEIRRISRQYPQPLVLIVHRADGRFDHLVAHGGRIRIASINTPTTTMPAEGPATR